MKNESFDDLLPLGSQIYIGNAEGPDGTPGGATSLENGYFISGPINVRNQILTGFSCKIFQNNWVHDGKIREEIIDAGSLMVWLTGSELTAVMFSKPRGYGESCRIPTSGLTGWQEISVEIGSDTFSLRVGERCAHLNASVELLRQAPIRFFIGDDYYKFKGTICDVRFQTISAAAAVERNPLQVED